MDYRVIIRLNIREDIAMFEFKTTINEFGRYVWAFTLYCAGRRSYAPSICEDVIKDNAGIILFPWRAHIIAHIMGSFAETFEERVAADRIKREAKAAGDPDWWNKGYKGGRLGADYDEDGWVRAVTFLAKHDDVDPALVNACWDGEDAAVTARFDDVDDFWFMVGSVLRHDIAQHEDAVFSAREITDFVKAHGDDLNPKWVVNLYRDITDDLWFLGDAPMPTPDWQELHDFLVDVATPEAHEVYAKKIKLQA